MSELVSVTIDGEVVRIGLDVGPPGPAGATGPAGPAGSAPSGATGTPQYNAGSSLFGGMSGQAWNDTTRSLTVAQGTQTALAPAVAYSATWNNPAVDFCTLLVNITNTDSGAASHALDIRFGGHPLFAVGSGPHGTAGAGGLRVVRRGGSFGLLSTQNSDFYLGRGVDGAAWLWIGSAGGGSLAFGSAFGGDAMLSRGPSGSSIRSNVPLGAIFTVGTLPSAATAGAGTIASVTDSSVTNRRHVVAGGGSDLVVVFSDGTDWRVV